MAAKKKTAKKKSSKAMMSMAEYERMMAEQASSESARTEEGASSPTISIRGGSFTYRDADLGDVMEVVVVNWANEKAYYDRPYDADNPSSPACWAVGMERPSSLVPSEDSPKQQSDDCSSCWANEWGSADTGKGKACKDVRRLMLISSDQLDDELEDIEVAMLKVPPASIKNFDKFVKGVDKMLNRPSYGVVCEVSFDHDEDYEVLKFKALRPLDSIEHLQKVMELNSQVEEEVLKEYDPDMYIEPVKKKAAKKKVAKKKVAKKKSSKFAR